MFPIVMESIKFNLDQQKKGNDLNIFMRDLKAYYPLKEDMKVESVSRHKGLKVYIDGAENLVLELPGIQAGIVKTEICNMEGRLLLADTGSISSDSVYSIPVSGFAPGIYVIKVYTNDSIFVSKFNVR